MNDTQLIFTRNRNQSFNTFAYQTNVAGEAGITGVSTSPIDWGSPQLNFTDYTGFSETVPAAVADAQPDVAAFVDAVTNTRAAHTLAAGVEVRRIDNNTFSDPSPEGQFTFNGLISGEQGANGQVVPGTGLDLADFLLGYPYSTTIRFGTPAIYLRNWGYIGYATDDWRVNKSFTLQYAVSRYEAFTPVYGALTATLPTST